MRSTCCDPEGKVSTWNAGAERIKGYRGPEIIGQHFSKFYTEEDREAGEPGLALRRAREEGRYETEAQRLRKDGSRFWAHVIIDPIFGEKGVRARLRQDHARHHRAESSDRGAADGAREP